MPTQPTKDYRRRAFTLLELLLVLAVMVAISAVALPGIFGMLANRQLVRGGNGVRIAMVQARLEAMRSGRTQMMRFEVQGNRFHVEPLVSATDVTEAGDMMGRGTAMATGGIAAPVPLAPPQPSAPAASEATRDPLSATMDGELLPDQVVFTAAQIQATARSATVEQAAGSAPADGWSEPVLFYADGTTSNAIVTVAREDVGRVLVRLRGLTGQTDVSGVLP